MLNSPKLTSVWPCLCLALTLADLAKLAKTVWSTFRAAFLECCRVEDQMDCMGLESSM